MALDELARWVFGFFCHQDPVRSFTPNGTALAICARCTGVYVGFALALPMLTVVRRLGGRGVMWLHGILVMQVMVFGFHLVPHGPMVRTLSGQMFAVGVVYFLGRTVGRGQSSPGKPTGRWLKVYLLGTAAAVAGLQLLVHLEWAWGAEVVNVLALIGLGIFGGLAAALPAGLIVRRPRAGKLVVSGDADWIKCLG